MPNEQKDPVKEARELIRQMPASEYFVPEKDAAEHTYQLILTMGFTAGVIGRIQVTPFTVGYVPIAQAFARAPELLKTLADELEQERKEKAELVQRFNLEWAKRRELEQAQERI